MASAANAGVAVQPPANEFLLLAKSTNSGIIANLLSTISYKKDQVRTNLLLTFPMTKASKLQFKGLPFSLHSPVPCAVFTDPIQRSLARYSDFKTYRHQIFG